MFSKVAVRQVRLEGNLLEDVSAYVWKIESANLEPHKNSAPRVLVLESLLSNLPLVLRSVQARAQMRPQKGKPLAALELLLEEIGFVLEPLAPVKPKSPDE